MRRPSRQSNCASKTSHWSATPATPIPISRTSSRTEGSRMPLNPKIEQILEMIARAQRPPMHRLSPQAARLSYEKSAQILDLDPAPMHHVEDLSVPMRDGTTIRARLYQPVEPNWFNGAPALVFYHGGGFTVGSVDTHDALCRMFARLAECQVLSVDYRLAPEF